MIPDDKLSPAMQLARRLVETFGVDAPEAWHKIARELGPLKLAALRARWPFWARSDQIIPNPPHGPRWASFVGLGGRGTGKTMCAARYVLDEILSGRTLRWAFVGPTDEHVRTVMLEGESGFLAAIPPWESHLYEASRGIIRFPNGGYVRCYTAEKPRSLRGDNLDAAWCDEFGYFQDYPKVYKDLVALIRKGAWSRTILTSTPVWTRPYMHELKRRAADPKEGIIYREMSARWNPYITIEQMVKEMGGSSIGRQEIDGVLLENMIGTLFNPGLIDKHRAPLGEVRRTVVGVDPAYSTGRQSDLTGIVVVSLCEDGHGYVRADRSGKYSADQWAREVAKAAEDFGADCVVVETNHGGQTVASNLRTVDKTTRIVEVVASRGKRTRAEPVVSLYEQGRMHHVAGLELGELEDQMCQWDPSSTLSPDRVDALVWACWELFKLGRTGAVPTGGLSVTVSKPAVSTALADAESRFGRRGRL